MLSGKKTVKNVELERILVPILYRFALYCTVPFQWRECSVTDLTDHVQFTVYRISADLFL